MGLFFIPKTPDEQDLEDFILEQASVDDGNITSRLDGIEVIHERPIPSNGLYHTRVNLRVTHYPVGIQVFFQNGELIVVNPEGRRIRPLEVYDVSDSAFRQTFIQLHPELLEFSAEFSPLKPDAYFCNKTVKGTTHAFLFVLDSYAPRLMLNYFLRNIFKALEEESWEDNDIAVLHMYIICPSNMVIVYLRRLLNSFLEKYYSDQKLIFHFVTRSQLYRKQKDDKEISWIKVSSEDY